MKRKQGELMEIEMLPDVFRARDEEQQAKDNAEIFKRLSRAVASEKAGGIFSVLSQVPIVAQAFKVEKGFKAVIPEKYLEGLQNNTLRLMKGKDGSIISNIQDVASGEIVHQLRLEEFPKNVNVAELSKAMSRIVMEMEEREFRKDMYRFRVEANAKLDELLAYAHDNRMIPAEAVKGLYERYQAGEIDKSQLLVELELSKAALLKEIEAQTKFLNQQKEKKAISEDKSKGIQTKIAYVLEAINWLRYLCFVELELNKKSKAECEKIRTEYTEALLEKLTPENLKLLSGFSNLEALGLKEDIWLVRFKPLAENLLETSARGRKLLEEK